jgi:hypothetical protein
MLYRINTHKVPLHGWPLGVIHAVTHAVESGTLPDDWQARISSIAVKLAFKANEPRREV